MTSLIKPKVLVFKTNLHRPEDLGLLRPLFESQPHILRWNVDQQDADRVLRVETRHLAPQDICRLVDEAGYACSELPD